MLFTPPFPPPAAHKTAAWEGHAKGRKLVFLHVPKTAGTTVSEAIQQWFHRNAVMPVPAGMMIPANHPELALAAHQYSLFGVGLHFDHDHVEAIRAALPREDRPFVFTVLREPRARLISQYMHWRRTPDSHLAGMSQSNQDAFLAARNLGIGQFLRCGLPLVEVHFRNFQTRVLAGGTTKATMTNDEILDTALSHAAEMDLIGTASDVDMTLAALASAYGRIPPDSAGCLNAAPDRPPLAFDDDSEAAIADFLSLDMKLWHAIHTGEWRRSEAPRPRFFSVNQTLVTALLGTGSSEFRMDMPLDGSGWHVREGDSPIARWTGPTKRSVIRLKAPPSQRLSVAVQIVSVLDHSVLDNLVFTLNGSRPSGPLVRGARDGFPEIRADFVLDTPPGATCDFAIEVPHTTSHDEVLGAVGDPRQKGVAVGAIDVFVSGGNHPTTLGDLFWKGEAWSSEDPAKFADFLSIKRDALPTPVAERSLALDLPLLAGILELIKPHRVYCVESTGPLFGLRSHSCSAAPPTRAAIVNTLFEMYDKAAIVRARAAQHEEAVLLLAFAEDSRLRTVIRNPFIAPHVHLIGGTSGILVANLSSLRRKGGQDLLDAFCWILSRIAATTPERIVRCDDPLQRAFLERQIVLALDVLIESATPHPTGDLTRTLTATLRPEKANATRVSDAYERFTTALSQAGTYLDLVDPALVAELADPLRKLAEHGVDQVPFDTLVTAHRAAFRIGEILVGWRRFGLETNATATLGRELAAAHKKERNEPTAQPMQFGIDAMVDAALAAAKKTTLALSDAAGKLDSKVIHFDADALIGLALAAAQQTSELLPKAARRLVGKAVHTQDESLSGILRPKPLKPFGEYIDFYRTEARIMGSQGIGAGIRLPLDGLRGGLDHVVRLNQAAREVEVALRLLGDHFPDEEIVWVDAGCSYGVLLNTVEPPSNIRDRCRFLGFDFNAPAVAVGRAAAANMGRSHCTFEVGDVADAKTITGDSRIHLITAFEVLEHCPDPLAVLRDYRGMAPGMLVVGSPLSEPQGILPTEQHLWSWDAGGFTHMVEAAGFAPVGVNQRHVGKFIGGHDWVTVTAVTAEPKDYAVV